MGLGGLEGRGQEAKQDSYALIAPELAIHNMVKNQKAADYYLSLRRMKKDIETPGSFFVRRNKEAKADYLSYVSKADGTVLFDVPLAADAEDPEFTIDEANGFLYYAHDLINPMIAGCLLEKRRRKPKARQMKAQLLNISLINHPESFRV